MMNGLNGANMAGMPVGIPTPAGHQAELNYIYGMVEELSKQLAENKRALEDVVSGVGRVRTRARQHALGNEEIIDSAAEEVNAQEQNLDHLISLLSEALEKAKYSRDANAALLAQYASVVATMLKQFHDYKAKHVADVSAWHRSYRAQLAEARAENCKLREQIWEMQAHAGHANESLRKFRAAYDDDAARWEQRVGNKALRQEVRFWKRMALPDVAEDDEMWSDDDDLIDPAEKKRLARVAEEQAAAAEEAMAAQSERERIGAGGGQDDDEGREGREGMPMSRLAGFGLGGVPMQREESAGGFGGGGGGGGGGMQQQQQQPVPPPRPGSANSMGSSGSTGSSGL